MAGAGTAGEHPLPDLAGAEPHLHRVVSQQGLHLQHYQLHQLRPVLRPRAHGVRGDGAHYGRYLQHLSAQKRYGEPLLFRVLRRQVGHLSRAQAVGHGDAGQQRAQRFADPALLLRQQHRDRAHQEYPLHPAKLPRHTAATGQPRRGGVHPAKAAEPHRQGLSFPWQTDGRRRIRQPDGRHGAGVPKAVQPDRRRCGGAADMVQDQLHLCIGKGPRGVDQRGRDFHRHPVQRHMERHAAEHRCLRQRGGAGTVLAEHAGAVRQRHSIRKSRRRIRHCHRQRGARLPAQIRPYRRRHSGADHMERAV